MSQFNKREKGYEEKHRLDQETAFKVQARRNKLLGLWAAEHIGLEGVEADAYAKDVVVSDFDRPGDEDVLEKVAADFESQGVSVSSEQIRDKMESLIPEARNQIEAEAAEG